MMKLKCLFLCLVISFFMFTGFSRAACDCETVEEVMKITLESVNMNAKEAVDAIMVKPDLSSVTDCLATVRGGLEGFFTLSLPSIDDLLSGICDAIMDMVYEAAMSYLEGAVSGVSTWFEFFDIRWEGAFGLDTNNGNSLWSIDGDIVTFTVTEHNVDLSGAIEDLFN